MKLIYGMLVLVLVGGLALPFFMNGPDGKPLASIDALAEDAVASVVPEAPVEMYRWKNEHGIWEFGESPPEHLSATRMSVDNSRTTTMGSEWNIEPVIAASGSAAKPFKAPNSVADAYRAAPELMDAAKRAAALLNDRQASLDEGLENVMQQVRQQESR